MACLGKQLCGWEGRTGCSAVGLWSSEAEGVETPPPRTGIFPPVNRKWNLLHSGLGYGQLPGEGGGDPCWIAALVGGMGGNTPLQWGKELKASVLSCPAGLLAPLGLRPCGPLRLLIHSPHTFPATGTADTVCELCPAGFFSGVSSPSEKCRPWTRYKSCLSLTKSSVGPRALQSPPPWPHSLVKVTSWLV